MSLKSNPTEAYFHQSCDRAFCDFYTRKTVVSGHYSTKHLVYSVSLSECEVWTTGLCEKTLCSEFTHSFLSTSLLEWAFCKTSRNNFLLQTWVVKATRQKPMKTLIKPCKSELGLLETSEKKKNREEIQSGNNEVLDTQCSFLFVCLSAIQWENQCGILRTLITLQKSLP